MFLDLEAKLQDASDAKIKMIVTDGVFSMDGNVAPLPEICDLADKYGALTFIDECHATGFLGPSGRGTEDFFGINGKVDIINSTLGKALGGAAGGYTTASHQIIQLLRQRARPYLFSNSLPPPVVACASQVFSMLMDDSSFVSKIKENTTRQGSIIWYLQLISTWFITLCALLRSQVDGSTKVHSGYGPFNQNN